MPGMPPPPRSGGLYGAAMPSMPQPGGGYPAGNLSFGVRIISSSSFCLINIILYIRKYLIVQVII